MSLIENNGEHSPELMGLFIYSYSAGAYGSLGSSRAESTWSEVENGDDFRGRE